MALFAALRGSASACTQLGLNLAAIFKGEIVNITVGLDPQTLRERVNADAVADRLSELGDQRSLSALGERVALLRFSGRLDEAMELANEAVFRARSDGERERLVAARIRRAQVQQFAGKLDAALAELSDCVTEASNHGWNETEGTALQYRGAVHFELGQLDDAARDLDDALKIRIRLHSSPDEIDTTMTALAVARDRRDGRAT